MLAISTAKFHERDESILAEKEQSLRLLMRQFGQVLVAYSGGVDSSFLAKVATDELGSNARCVIGLSPSVSEHQRDQAARFARQHGLNLRSIRTDEIADPNYTANPTNRCYFCKSELYAKLSGLAASAIVLDGTNADDLKDQRPGRAAATEHNVRSPLAEIGFTKENIRELSQRDGLETWDKPASPCLASRIAHGVPVTISRLSQVEKGEAILREMGFLEFRVRVHGDLARIEIAKAEMVKMLEAATFDSIAARLNTIGFKHVTLDLNGFRSGSMNVTDDTIS